MFRIRSVLCLLALWSPLLWHCSFNRGFHRFCLNNVCGNITSDGGHICYHPFANNTITSNSCSGGIANSPDYQAVLETHLKQGLSIAYYTDDSNQLLGGVDHTVPQGTILKICLSGKADNGGYQTLCSRTNVDDLITVPIPFCAVALGQNSVSDSCYIPGSPSSLPSTSASPSSTSPGSASNPSTSPASTSSTTNSSSLPQSLPNSLSKTTDRAVRVGAGVGVGVGIPVLSGTIFVLFLVIRRRRKGKGKQVTNNKFSTTFGNITAGAGGDGGHGQSVGTGGGGGGVNLNLAQGG